MDLNFFELALNILVMTLISRIQINIRSTELSKTEFTQRVRSESSVKNNDF